jgi:hypothetical protein
MVSVLSSDALSEAHGVNTLDQLKEVEQILLKRSKQ